MAWGLKWLTRPDRICNGIRDQALKPAASGPRLVDYRDTEGRLNWFRSKPECWIFVVNWPDSLGVSDRP